jgi:hypothetical protein
MKHQRGMVHGIIRDRFRMMGRDPFPPREDPPAPPKPPAQEDLTDFSEEVRTAVGSTLKRHAGPQRALATVLAENYTYRERHRTDQTKIQELTDKLPKDGSVSIPKGEATVFEEYKALGDLETLKKMAKAYPTLVQFQKDVEDKTLAAQAADTVGWDGDVLADLAKTKGFRVEVKKEKVKKTGDDGKEVTVEEPVAYAFQGDSKTGVALDKFGEEVLAKYLPSLRKADTEEKPTGGVLFPSVSTKKTGDGKPGSAVEKHLAKTAEKNKDRAKGNPLSAAPAATK